MRLEDFVGREPEARVIMTNTEQQRSTLLVGKAGLGKSSLLEWLSLLLQDQGKLVSTERIAPFGAFIRAVFDGLERHRLIGEPWDDWRKKHSTNEHKARELVRVLSQSKKCHSRHRRRYRYST